MALGVGAKIAKSRFGNREVLWFVLDSGATHHMVGPDAKSMVSRSLEETIPLRVASGRLGEDAKFCVFRENSLQLRRGLFHKSLGVSLLSVERLRTDGWEVKFNKRGAFVTAPWGETILPKKEGGLWLVPMARQSAMESVLAASAGSKEREHQRMCHFWTSSVRVGTCEACARCKGQKPSHRKLRPEEYTSKASLDAVAFDFVGPFEVPSVKTKNRWLFTSVDDFDDWVEVAGTKKKDDNAKCLQDYVDKLGKPTVARSDNAREFKEHNSKWRKSCRRLKIKCRFSPPYEPEGNGKIERTNRTIVDAGRTILRGVDKSLWLYAMRIAAHVWNRLPRRQRKSPFERRHNKVPKLDYLRRFGCLRFAKNYVRTKLDDKHIRSVFLGYSDNSSSYLTGHFTPTGRFEVIESYAVKFHEDTLVADLGFLKKDGEIPQVVDVTPVGFGESVVLPQPKKRGRPPKNRNSVSALPGGSGSSGGAGTVGQNSGGVVQSGPLGVVSGGAKSKKRAANGSQDDDKQVAMLLPRKRLRKKTKPADADLVPVFPRAADFPKRSTKRKEFSTRMVPQVPASSVPAPKQQGNAKRSREAFFDAMGQAGDTDAKRARTAHCIATALLTGAEEVRRSEKQKDEEFADVFLGHAEVLFGGSTPKVLRGPEKEKWQVADDREQNALESMGCWHIINKSELRKDDRIVPLCNLYTIKRDGRYKCRCVCLGNRIPADEQQHDTFSPAISHLATKALLIRAARSGESINQLDIGNAFINATLINPDGTYKERVICRLPSHWGGHLVQLDRSLYGLRSAPRHWFDALSKSMKEDLGYEMCDAEPGLFKRVVDGVVIRAAVYVDDVLLSGPVSLIESERDRILTRWAGRKIEPTEGKNGFKIYDVLGMDVHYSRQLKTVKFSQQKAITKLLDKFKFSGCKTARTPAEPGIFINEGKSVQESFNFRSFVGSVNYIGQLTRPDICHTVQRLSSCMTDPRSSAKAAALRLARYLKGTSGVELVYSPGRERGFYARHELATLNSEQNPLVGFCDADYGGQDGHVKGCAISGNVLYYYGCPLFWKSSRQQVVSLSSAESEFVSLFSLSKSVAWVKQVLTFILEGGERVRTPIFCDNQSAIAMARSTLRTKRTRHMAQRYFYVQQELQNGNVDIRYVQTARQCADGLTKPVTRELLELLIKGYP